MHMHTRIHVADPRNVDDTDGQHQQLRFETDVVRLLLIYISRCARGSKDSIICGNR